MSAASLVAGTTFATTNPVVGLPIAAIGGANLVGNIPKQVYYSNEARTYKKANNKLADDYKS